GAEARPATSPPLDRVLTQAVTPAQRSGPREVRQAERQAGADDGQRRGGIQREEIDAGVMAVDVDVGPNVRLQEGEPRDGWQPDRPRLLDRERDEAHVGRILP